MALQTMNVKIEEVCRTCLSKEFKMLSVFEVRLGMITLDNVINSITGLKIAEGDGLPSTICNDCKEKVASAYDFKNRSLEAELTLRSLLTRENGNENVENEITDFESNSVEIKTEQFTQQNNDGYMDLDLTSALSHFEESYNELDSVKCENDIKQDFDITHSSVSVKSEDGTKNKSWTVKTLQKDSTYCPLCGAIFNDAEGLTKHAWDQHEDLMGPKKRGRPKKLLTSTILIKLSENGYNLKYKKNKKHNCMFCKENFKAKEDLILHVVAHGDIKTISCLLCKKIYLKKSYYDSHNCAPGKNPLEHHKQSKPPDVEEKERPIQYKEILLQHLLIDRDSANIDFCEQCGELFTNGADLNKHKDHDHPELSVRCHLCDKVFATLKSAARHRTVCARVERQFACTTCDLRFAHEVSLNKHILSAHTGQSVSVRFMDKDRTPPPHRCEICNRRFHRQDSLTRHAKTHKQVEKIFECDVCSKKFNRRDNLRQHLRIHKGPGERGPPSTSTCLCLYCGRSFSNSSNLIVHMRRHTGEKPYKCDFCGKGFPRSSDLQCHRRSHTGEKPCVCGVCGKAFSRSNKLSRHMRVHTGVKPYKCPYCEKAFSQSNDLTLHVRRHTGDKPYVCEMCGDRFIQGTALQNHRRAHGHYPPSAAPTLTPIVYTVQNVTQNH